MNIKILFICVQLLVASIAIGQTSPVQWTKLINTTATGNTLTKNGTNGWNAGASSMNVLAANTDGYLEITISQDNTHRFFGLTQSDDAVSFKDIDFAVFLLSNKTIRIYEAGSYKGSFGGYALGDKIKVERVGSQINYKKNNVLLYSSTPPLATSLVVDATIYHNGGTVENAVCSFAGGPTCTDADNDGVCAAADCNDNDAAIPAAPGTACNDANANTINDVIQADGCTCLGEIAGCTDVDNDGICVDVDCNDNNPNLPATPGTACDDFNANTTNDVIQADGCTCQGVIACTDADNDGVCAEDDCNDADANFPMTPGTACNDNNAATISDQIQADGCTCLGSIPNCTDADNDNVCAENDCDDNNPNLPAAAGTACDDGNAETINDVILTDGCSCQGTTVIVSGTSSLWTNQTSHILFDGKVVIGPAGTTIPGNFNLYVTKGILAERVRVAMTNGSWADYVFAKDYPLPTLSYVESYIQTHQHLPNVPSAKEVETNGLDVGTMDATLLRQIEELYLHVIDLNKKVEGMEKELRELKKGKE